MYLVFLNRFATQLTPHFVLADGPEIAAEFVADSEALPLAWLSVVEVEGDDLIELATPKYTTKEEK